MPSSPEAASAAPGEIETPLSPDTASAAPDTASAASGVVVKLTGDPPTAADHALEARHEAKHEAKISDAAYRAVLTKKLVLRTGLSLSSAKIGDLPAGKEIIIINRQQTEDGVERVRVGQDSSPRGIAVHNLGWVTALKDGERKLTTVLERGGSPRHHVRGFIEGMDNLGDSVAQRIALRRRKRLHARGALPRTHTAEGSHAVASMMLSGGNYTRTSRGGGAVREANVPVPHQKLDAWVPVEMLVKHRATLLQTANLERQRDPEAPPAIKLARLFEWKQLTVTQLMREWDTNNDGFVSQAEFCRGVRTAGLSEDEFSSTSLKAIFSSIDVNHNDSLDPKELASAMRRMQESLPLVDARKVNTAAWLDDVQAVIDAYDDAAKLSQLYEEKAAELSQLRVGSLEARIGEIFRMRNVRMTTLMAEWDADDNNSIDKTEFRRALFELGLRDHAREERPVADAELDRIFDGLDVDKNGVLTVDELQAGLKAFGHTYNRARRLESEGAALMAKQRRDAETAQYKAVTMRANAEKAKAGREKDLQAMLQGGRAVRPAEKAVKSRGKSR